MGRGKTNGPARKQNAPFLVRDVNPLTRQVALCTADILINTNYVDNNVVTNMIYVNNFARVGRCRNPWAND